MTSLKIFVTTLSIIIVNINYSQIQKKESFFVDNFIEFYQYQEVDKPTVYATKFILKVTNMGNEPIPDLRRVHNLSKHVIFYINGKPYDPMSFNIQSWIDGSNPSETIGLNSYDRYELDLGSNNKLIASYGNEFTVQWEYMHIKSSVIKINLSQNLFCYS